MTRILGTRLNGTREAKELDELMNAIFCRVLENMSVICSARGSSLVPKGGKSVWQTQQAGCRLVVPCLTRLGGGDSTCLHPVSCVVFRLVEELLPILLWKTVSSDLGLEARMSQPFVPKSWACNLEKSE